MRFRVTWDPEAIDELQRIYDDAVDKEGMVNAVTRIGLELSAVPLEAGESRDEDTRIVFKFPLVVWIRINVGCARSPSCAYRHHAVSNR